MVAKPSYYNRVEKPGEEQKKVILYTVCDTIIKQASQEKERREEDADKPLVFDTQKLVNWETFKESVGIRYEATKVARRYIKKNVTSKFPTGFLGTVCIPFAVYGVYCALQTPDLIKGRVGTSTLPGIERYAKRPLEVSTTTCHSIDYLNKVDWEEHKRMNYFPGSTFIVFHPNYRLSNNRFFLAKCKTKFDDYSETYVLLNKNANVLFLPSFLYQNYSSLTRSSDLKIPTNTISQTGLRRMQYWQIYFNDLDMLPTRMSHFFNPMQNYTKLVTGKERYKIRNAKLERPLFRHIYNEGKCARTVFKPGIKHKTIRKVKAHKPYKETPLAHLSRTLIDSECFSKTLKGKQKTLQYKVINDASHVNKLLKLYVHSEVLSSTKERGFEVDYFFNKKFILQHHFQKSSRYKSPLQKLTKNLFDYRLRYELQKDIVYLRDQEWHQSRFVSQFPATTSSLHRLKSLPTKNPYNLTYDNQMHGRLEAVDAFPILTRFQTKLAQHIHRQLYSNNLFISEIPFFHYLKSPLRNSYKLEAIRIRKVPKEKWQSIRRHVINANSSLLKRHFSGYLYPDTELQALLNRNHPWINRLFYPALENNDDVFLRIIGPDAANPWILKQASQQSQQVRPIDGVESSLRHHVEQRNFAGKTETDWGAVAISNEFDKPRRYRYPKKRWLMNFDPPESPNLGYSVSDEASLYFDYAYIPKNQFVVEEEDGKTLGPSWANDNFYLMDNQRYLPLPQNPVDLSHNPRARTLESQNYEPRTRFYKVNFYVFLGHFNIASSNYSILHHYEQGETQMDWGSYHNQYNRSLIIKCSFTDPVFLGQLGLIAYFYKVSKRIYQNYSDAFWRGLEEFFLKIELKGLFGFESLGAFVIPPVKLTFADLMGGYALLQQFLPTIIFLRNKRQLFSEVESIDNSWYSEPVFSWSHVFSHKAQLLEQEQINNNTGNVKRPKGIPSFYQSNIVPKGFLLVGSPGTGKTFLVKALSGETGCPVITNQSNANNNQSELSDMDQTLLIRKLFKSAQIHSPSILFIDEIDTVGTKRSYVLSPNQDTGPRHLYEPGNHITLNSLTYWQQTKGVFSYPDFNRTSLRYWSIFNPKIALARVTPTTRRQRFYPSIPYYIRDVEFYEAFTKQSQSSLDTITTLLCELDGLSNRENVVVVGATNRPAALDPALIRPGRLGHIIYLDLPTKQKRVELLKYYAGNQFTQNVNWDFFASHAQTGGLSSAHLKVAMNISTLALIKKSFHQSTQSKVSDVKKSFKKFFDKRQITPHTNSTIEYAIQGVRFQNVYVQQRSYKLAIKFNQTFCRPERFLLQTNDLYFCLTTHVDPLQTQNKTVLVNQIKGITIPKPSLITTLRNQKITTTSFLNQEQKQSQNQNQTLLKTINSEETINVSAITKRIYKRHSKKLRLAYLLCPKEQLFLDSVPTHLLPNDELLGLDYFETVVQRQKNPESEKIFQLYKTYVRRVFKVHMFGATLLMRTGYSLNNPLMFSLRSISVQFKKEVIPSNFKWVCFSNENLLHYRLVSEETSTSIFLTSVPQQIQQWQTKHLGDHLALRRAAYYSSGKAMIIGLLNHTIFEATILTLWSNIKSLQENRLTQTHFVQEIGKLLVTRKDFENYLLALIAGKVGEQFLITSNHSSDCSDLGMVELQKMGWLASIMIEKGLMFETTPALTKALVAEPFSFSFSKNKEVDSETLGRDYQPGLEQAPLRRPNDWSPPQYWWEKKARYDALRCQTSPSIWTAFFDQDFADPNLPPEKFPYRHDYYESNTTTNAKKQSLQSAGPLSDKPNANKTTSKDEKPIEKINLLDTLLNEAQLGPLFNEFEIQWNDMTLMQSQKYMSQIILECFTKSFYLLETNRPLFDYYLHHFYRNNRLTGIEAQELASQFLTPWTIKELTPLIGEDFLNLFDDLDSSDELKSSNESVNDEATASEELDQDE